MRHAAPAHRRTSLETARRLVRRLFEATDRHQAKLRRQVARLDPRYIANGLVAAVEAGVPKVDDIRLLAGLVDEADPAIVVTGLGRLVADERRPLAVRADAPRLLHRADFEDASASEGIPHDVSVEAGRRTLCATLLALCRDRPRAQAIMALAIVVESAREMAELRDESHDAVLAEALTAIIETRAPKPSRPTRRSGKRKARRRR